MTEAIRLRTGVESTDVLVTTTMLHLDQLIGDIHNPMAFYELAMVARDPSHAIWGPCRARLIASGLLDGGGVMHSLVRDIVLAATEGDGIDMRLVNPVAS